ncbi:hypothetical protein PFY12_03165 [Chryseobacterium camelliae]|uniref:Uncharacterized protein n=1 Tax=Chryseobacterium camelliae TaxID=1265445 RepID=A0ABY7QN64_9FLAO|nr:hypothetical protein [Chryseobacterium camelliae]WBV61127.1 hypothetical protein PFY12_03165 [Chryseobacterium camelliae]
MKYKSIFFLLFLYSSQFIYSQNSSSLNIQWQKCFGESGAKTEKYSVQAPAGGYSIERATGSSVSIHDRSGRKIFNKKYSESKISFNMYEWRLCHSS